MSFRELRRHKLGPRPTQKQQAEPVPMFHTYLSVATNYHLLPSKHHISCPFKAEEKEKEKDKTNNRS